MSAKAMDDHAMMEAADAIRQCAASFAAKDEFAGVVVLADGERLLLDAAYGLANPADKLPNRPDTPFNIASVGKIFTSTAIGQLIDAGKVHLADELGRHLPELPPRLARLTIGQVLNHSSGIGEIFTPANQHRIAAARTARELAGLIAMQPIQFEPGSQHRYSNSGPILAGAVIEAVSGKSYAEYVRRNIFRAAGMTSSSLGERPRGAAKPLTRSEVLTGEMRISSDAKPPRREADIKASGPFGGGYNSALDLVRFARAMRSDRLVSAATRALLWSNPRMVPGAGPGEYAYGFQTSSEGGVRTVGHSGLAGGANAEFHWAPGAGWTLVVLSNYDPMAATMIGNAARLVLTGLESPQTACEAARRGRGMPRPMGPGPGPATAPSPAGSSAAGKPVG